MYLDKDHHLIGIVTDGDVRRALQKHEDIRALCAVDIMTRNPVKVSPSGRCKRSCRSNGESCFPDFCPAGH